MHPLVSAAWLQDHLEDSGLVVVDTQFHLPEPEWGRARYGEGHIPGAVFADINEDLAAPRTGTNGRHPLPPVEAMAETLGQIGIGDGATVVAYDSAGGMYAARLWWMLRYLGHPRVALLDGGLGAWDGPLATGEEHRPPARFSPRPIPEMARDVDAVASRLTNEILLDARESVRFRGEVEPIDPVAGRIPGARHRFWKANLDASGRFRKPAELRAAFDRILEDRQGRPVVCYCGSGLTAAHNALALTLAGVRDVAVYSGSWSEWIAAPERPVATGPA